MNAHNIHSTDIDREQKEKNDPDFTRYTQRSFIATTIVSLIICPGLIYIGLTFGEDIDAFLKTKTGFWTLVGVIVVSGVSWFVGYIKKMME
jgi:FtsH-binding integral membrane protein